ncbi:hypothetical protein ACI0FM_08530 [Paenochrobactrum sp. BZR 588]|uniref:hypothetical protein n=1 Tax=unclassified Paenochrobactrum TaxID=2639760 RepID=UPI0038537DE8
MKEDATHQEQLNRMDEQIAVLQQALCITIATMTNEQREFIHRTIGEYADKLAEAAKETNDVDLQSSVEIAREVAENFRGIEDWAASFKAFNR